MTIRHRAGVRGSPVEHSLSPVLHHAAYQALGLGDWDYDRAEVRAEELAAHVASLDPSYRGLSLTAPLKEAAFAVVHTVSDVARRVGAINTVVRDERGWSGHNTDVYGIVQALRAAGVGQVREAVLVGAGATARSAIAALGQMGARRVCVMVRATARPETLALARELGMSVDIVPMGAWPGHPDIIVSTVPSRAYAGLLDTLPSAPEAGAVLDCVYGEPTGALLAAARDAGYVAVPGTVMLLHQASGQVTLMTGREAPVRAMQAALEAALAQQA
jgi:shikimate dehydrogenase